MDEKDVVRIRCRFVGKDGHMGYRQGKVYNIHLVGNTLYGLNEITYKSVEEFLSYWLPLKPGD